MIQAARADMIDGLEEIKEREKITRLEEKFLHGHYLWETKEVRSDQCWAWLQNEI